MVRFEINFECCTRQDAIYTLQEIISQLENDCYCGYLCSADGSWSSKGEDENEDD